MTTIIVTHENNQIDEHDFEPEIKSITIGRRSTNDVCIANLSVSGSHAKIMITDEGAMVEDLNSTNGTYINGRLISRQKLNDGDDIVLGRIRVTFLMPALQNMAVDDSASLSLDNTDAGNDFDDEPPLTLAEKARLHRTHAAPDHGAQKTNNATSKGLAADPNEKAESNNAADTDQVNGKGQHQIDGQIDGQIYGKGNDSGLTPDASSSAMHDQSSQLSSETTAVAGARNVQSPDNLFSPVTAPTASPDAPTPNVNGRATTATETADSRVGATSVTHELDTSALAQTGAVIEIKNGAKSGQVLPIDKPVTTLGRPGIQIAAIMKKPEGYFLMHIESDGKVDPPRLNSNSIGDEPVLLRSGDALNVAGIDVQFMLS